MALDDIFAAFQEAIGIEACAFVGPDGKDDESAPPRITWIPLEADQLAPRRTAGGPGDDGAILTRRWLLQLDIWGDDLAGTEALVDLFLATLHDLLSQHSYKPGKEKWNVGGVNGRGVVCQMVIAIERPILRTAQPTVTLKSIRASMGLGSPPATPVVSTFTKETT